MTTTDRIEKASDYIAKIALRIPSDENMQDIIRVCSQLLLVCRNQQEEIEDMRRNIEWLTSHTKHNY